MNLVLGLVAIVMALASLVLSWKWSQDGARALDRAQDTLRDVEKATDQLLRAVETRMDEIIKRAMPSAEEQAFSQAMPSILGAVLENPELLGTLMKLQEQLPPDD